MKNVNQVGLNELPQIELTQIEGGSWPSLSDLAKKIDDEVEAACGARPLKWFE